MYVCVGSSGVVSVLLSSAGGHGLPAGWLPPDAHIQRRDHLRLHRRRAEETGQGRYLCIHRADLTYLIPFSFSL